MSLDTHVTKCKSLVESVEKLVAENAPEEKITAAESELAAAMKALERAKSLDATAKALAAMPAPIEHKAPAATPGVTVKSVPRHVAQVHAFAKVWTGKPLSGDEEMALVAPTSERYAKVGGLALPDMVKTLIFGKAISRRMGWAKVISPEEDGEDIAVNRDYAQGLSYIPGEDISLMDLCTIRPAPMGAIYVPRLKRASCDSEWGVATSWISTGSSKPESEPVFEQIKVECYENTAYVEVVDAMLGRVGASSFDLAGELARMFRGAIRNAVNDAIMVGGGAAALQPTGVVGFTGIGSHQRAVANQVSYADLAALQNEINPRAMSPRATWLIDQTVRAHIQGLVSTTGQPIFASSAAAGPFDRLLGFPYITTVGLPTLGSTGDVVFGNWDYYTVALENDIVIASDNGNGLGFRQNRTNIKAFIRVGGYPIEPDAFANMLVRS